MGAVRPPRQWCDWTAKRPALYRSDGIDLDRGSGRSKQEKKMTTPFALRGLDHIVLRVVDLDRMLGFYKQVLGCTDERAQPEIGLHQLRAGRALIDLVPVDGKLGAMGGAPPGREGRHVDHFALDIEPFDEPAIRDR